MKNNVKDNGSIQLEWVLNPTSKIEVVKQEHIAIGVVQYLVFVGVLVSMAMGVL